MLADPAKVHHFADIGYSHDGLYVCPANAVDGQLPESKALAGSPSKWDSEASNGIGCRCKCPGGPFKRRNTRTYCTTKMDKPNTRRRTWFGEGS